MVGREGELNSHVFAIFSSHSLQLLWVLDVHRLRTWKFIILLWRFIRRHIIRENGTCIICIFIFSTSAALAAAILLCFCFIRDNLPQAIYTPSQSQACVGATNRLADASDRCWKVLAFLPLRLRARPIGADKQPLFQIILEECSRIMTRVICFSMKMKQKNTTE